MRAHPLWFSVLALASLTPGGTAQCWKETALIHAAALGNEVDLCGDTVVVGDQFDDTVANNAGAVRVFRDDGTGTWQQVAFLVASDASSSDAFGSSVSISGDTLVVGATRATSGSTPNAGAAYVFERDLGGPGAWGEAAKLLHTGPQMWEAFGNAVSISGDTAVVGAAADGTVAGPGAGSATVFDRNLGGPENWGLRKKLEASNAQAGNAFGRAVSIDGDHIVIGANGGQAAYVLERDLGGNNQWGEEALIGVPPETAPGAEFGISVAISGATVVVGTDVGLPNAAAPLYAGAFVFERDLGGSGAWGQAAALDSFVGNAVAVSGDLVVSASTLFGGAGVIYARDEGGPGAWGPRDHLQAHYGGDSGFLALSGERIVVSHADLRVYGPAGPSECTVGWDETMLAGPGSTPGDRVGLSVSLSGGTAVVGAPGESPSNPLGSAYVFERGPGGGWLPSVTLLPSAGNDFDLFGFDVALDADTIVVGAPQDAANGPGSGAAYVFERNLGGAGNWGESNKLAPFGPQTLDEFGVAVTVSGDSLVVGAPRDITPGGVTGSAHVFDRDLGGQGNWGQRKKLLASNGGDNDAFGTRVALSGDDLAISAWSGTLSGLGSVYLLERDLGGNNQWEERLRLDAPPGLVHPRSFGADLSFWESTLAVGAHPVSFGPGRAYLFERDLGGASTWGLAAGVQASDGIQYDDFGASVSVFADRLVVGKDKWAEDAYLFERDLGGAGAWGEVGKLAHTGSVGYGTDVALGCDTAIVGAPLEGGTGGARVYETDTTLANYCTAGFSASGCQALLSGSGRASVSSNSGFVVNANTVEAGKSGFFYYGFNGGQVTPWGNGTSLQCVVPPAKRTPLMPGVGTPGTCEGFFAMDLNAYWQSAPSSKLPPANQQVHLQFWYRDPQSTSNLTRSLSDGLIFTTCP